MASPSSHAWLDSLRRDRLVVAGGLLLIALLSWLYVARIAMLPGQGAMSMAMPMGTGTAAPAVAIAWLVPMWTVMMAAMMLPSAAPAILLFTALVRGRRRAGSASVPTAVFTSGYLLVWTLYATVAAFIQWTLHRAALLTPGMASARPWLAGSLLLAAGIYQFLPIKTACLHHCRSPLHFFGTEWREGMLGALLMGMRHGTYCLGCCWLLMALLFVAGVMNLLWVATLAIVVLVEKLLPGGRLFGRLTGAAFLGWGVWLLVAAAR